MMDESQFRACRDALEAALRERFPDAVLREFGADTRNPGVGVDLSTNRGMANVSLWQNLSFDVEAIENKSGRVLLRKSTGEVTPGEVTTTVAELVSALR
jgi:hypothetical protein